MKTNLNLLLLAGLLLVACSKNISMTTYQKMSKIQTLENFKEHYGKTVKLLGTLVEEDLKNNKVVVAENIFFIKLSDGQLVMLPTKNDSEALLSWLRELNGKEVFVIGQPIPANTPIFSEYSYEGLLTPLFFPRGLVTQIDDKTCTERIIRDLEIINIHKEAMKDEDVFFAYLAGTTTQKIASEIYPLTISLRLQDKTPFEVTVNEKSDIDILGYVGEKVIISGKIKTNTDQVVVIDAQMENYEKYMDYNSAN